MSVTVPRLILVTDRSLCAGRTLNTVVEAAVAAGLPAVQLREKDLDGAALYALAKELRRMTAGRALLLVNDRADLALAVGADGVHLPSVGLPVAAARRVLGSRALIGRSVHSVAEASAAAAEGADYVQAGTIFATQSKAGAVPAGPAFIGAVREAVDRPVVAIGGIKPANARAAIRAGAHGVAVISAITAAEDPGCATRELLAQIEGRD